MKSFRILLFGMLCPALFFSCKKDGGGGGGTNTPADGITLVGGDWSGAIGEKVKIVKGGVEQKVKSWALGISSEQLLIETGVNDVGFLNLGTKALYPLVDFKGVIESNMYGSDSSGRDRSGFLLVGTYKGNNGYFQLEHNAIAPTPLIGLPTGMSGQCSLLDYYHLFFSLSGGSGTPVPCVGYCWPALPAYKPGGVINYINRSKGAVKELRGGMPVTAWKDQILLPEVAGVKYRIFRPSTMSFVDSFTVTPPGPNIYKGIGGPLNGLFGIEFQWGNKIVLRKYPAWAEVGSFNAGPCFNSTNFKWGHPDNLNLFYLAPKGTTCQDMAIYEVDFVANQLRVVVDIPAAIMNTNKVVDFLPPRELSSSGSRKIWIKRDDGSIYQKVI